jgi:hypothetical protein
MLKQLGCCPALILVVYEHFRYYFLPFDRHMRYFVSKTLELLRRKVDLHMSSVLSEILEDLIGWGAENSVDSVYLVELVVSGKQWTER